LGISPLLGSVKLRLIAGLADRFRSRSKRLAQLLQLLEQTLAGNEHLLIAILLLALHWSLPPHHGSEITATYEQQM